MKKQLFFIVIAGLFSSIASATDLYVRENGAGGSYPTISAAITAAVDGDRIIIRPKAAGLPYIEGVTIDKSLSFVSETNFSKYLIQGSVTVNTAPGRVVTISNLDLSSNFYFSGATAGGRTTLNLNNSSLNAVNAGFANTTVNMSGCTTSGVTINHGRLTGNRIGALTIGGTALDSNPSTDDIEIIANLFTVDLSINQRNYVLKFLNNYVVQNASVSITGAKNGSTNEIRNNVINYSASISALYFNLPAGNTATFSVLNNIITCSATLSNYGEISNNNSNSVIYAMYNMSSTPFTTVGTVIASNNVGSVTLSFNNTTATVTGSALTNAGAPDDDYADIDLSRNDVGNAGGSDSWANYWPAAVGNKPQVNYLLTPRRIYTGTTEMNATGSGYTK